MLKGKISHLNLTSHCFHFHISSFSSFQFEIRGLREDSRLFTEQSKCSHQLGPVSVRREVLARDVRGEPRQHPLHLDDSLQGLHQLAGSSQVSPSVGPGRERISQRPVETPL